MPIVLPPLIELAGLLVALGMVLLAAVIVAALFQVANTTVGWIPWLGKKASNGVEAVGHRINAKLSAAALQLQGAITDSWHLLANLIDHLGDAIWKATQVGARALWLVEVKYPLDVLSAVAHGARTVVHQTTKVTATTVKRVVVVERIGKAQLDALARKVRGIDKRLAAIAAAGAGAVALPWPRIRGLERKATTQAKRIGRLEHRFGRKTFAALVAGALGVLGLNWVRRSCVRRNNDLLCKTDFAALEALLAGAVLVVGSQSVVRFANAMLAVEDEFVDVLKGMVVELRELDGGS